MAVIAIPDENMDKKLYPEASKILDSMEEFLPELWDSPHTTEKTEFNRLLELYLTVPLSVFWKVKQPPNLLVLNHP